LDHGVFVPFKLMFGDKIDDIPIIQVSIEGSDDPEQNWAVGKAVSKLRFVSDSNLYVLTFVDLTSDGSYS